VERSALIAADAVDERAVLDWVDHSPRSRRSYVRQGYIVGNDAPAPNAS
jgi:hypothetical protein